MNRKECQEEKGGLGYTRYVVSEETGEVLVTLSDRSSTGRERPWRERKIDNQHVEECYRRLSAVEDDYWERKAERLHQCGSQLFFSVHQSEGGGVKLKVKHANSCRVRLCPLCAWRRSGKVQAHMRRILEWMEQEGRYAYLLLTLTVPSVDGDGLSEMLDGMMKAWKRLEQTAAFQRAVKGWYRGLEVTHNVERDDYHPHFHCLLAVDRCNYFTGKQYISHDAWLTMWRKATRDGGITQVDIRRVKPKGGGDLMGAVCEVAKYTVKTGDYVMPWDWEMSCDVIRVLDGALDRRRLVAFGGVLKVVRQALGLDDEIDGDLTKIEGEEEDEEGELIGEICAVWHVGYQQYIISTGD